MKSKRNIKNIFKRLVSVALIVTFVISSVGFTATAFGANEVSASADVPGDAMVYYVQKWLNQEYGSVPGFGSVTENGKTGWNTVYGLTRALQYELGITNMANNFGPATQAAYKENILCRNDGVTDNKYAILQGALWCKGYTPGYYISYNKTEDKVTINAVFNESVEKAVIRMKTDAGLIEPDGTVTLNTMKALLSMDSFKLLGTYGGKAEIRAMQQTLNRKYEDYIGLMPCDGVYGRNTNKALIIALQAEEGIPESYATGSFGNQTKACCPTIPYDEKEKDYNGKKYSEEKISAFTELLQFALYVNGFGNGETNGVFSSEMSNVIREFQRKYALEETGNADLTTWMSLLISCGNKERKALACDCATILTEEKVATLLENGYKYVGRYLTGTYNGGISKALTREEADMVLNAGLRFFPIYQDGGKTDSYFNTEQGRSDAKSAIEAASNLGIPEGTIIYFAVDFDSTDSNITNGIMPYFKAVSDEMNKSVYKTGIYGTRNACSRVSNAGYAVSSFISDMSTGYSGNFGFTIPDNWAFDQFANVTIGSGAGRIEIDKDGFSGRDNGVGELLPIYVGKITIVHGETVSLSSFLLPDCFLNNWKSEITDIAEVDQNGNVTGKKAGTTTITAVCDMETQICWTVEVKLAWWQNLLIFIGIGLLFRPSWIY